MNRIFNPLIAQHRKVAAAVAIAAASSNALALGGLDKAKTAADDIKTGLFALVGVVATRGILSGILPGIRVGGIRGGAIP